MNEVRATVERVAAGQVWLRLPARSTGCGRCHEPGGCGGTRIAEIFKARDDCLVVPDRFGATEGQSVWVGVAEQTPLRAAVLCYALPLALGLAGGAIAMSLAPFGNSDLNALGGLVLGLSGGWYFLRRSGPGAAVAAEAWSVRPADGEEPECGRVG